eukprot:784604-Pyramimonas_sp.AAC.1
MQIDSACLASIPSLSDFQRSCQQARKSAPGCDEVAGGLMRAHPTVIAEYYYPLQLKSALTLAEP